MMIYSDYARSEINSGDKKELFCIGGDGLAAVYVKETGESNQLYFTVKDHLNSTWALINESGSIEENYAFNPWGKRVNPTNWDVEDARTNLILDIGFTGHEHLDELGLINMKARMYDPVLGQFISPDPYVLDEGLSINYNRYAYCLNNPLMYTDPTGLYCEFHGSFCDGSCQKPGIGDSYFNYDDGVWYVYEGEDDWGGVKGSYQSTGFAMDEVHDSFGDSMGNFGTTTFGSDGQVSGYYGQSAANKLYQSAEDYARTLLPLIGNGKFQQTFEIGKQHVITVSVQEGRYSVWDKQIYSKGSTKPKYSELFIDINLSWGPQLGAKLKLFGIVNLGIQGRYKNVDRNIRIAFRKYENGDYRFVFNTEAHNVNKAGGFGIPFYQESFKMYTGVKDHNVFERINYVKQRGPVNSVSHDYYKDPNLGPYIKDETFNVSAGYEQHTFIVGYKVETGFKTNY